jgi:anthraniloyl-CoA monooxygenase
MRIAIAGGGPAGLYFAILMKQQDPSHHITVFERDGPDDTFGWGIVFSDQTFSYLAERDAPSCHAILGACQIWDNVDVVYRGQTISIGGNRFSGISRLTFLKILRRRCEALGVEVNYRTTVGSVDELGDAQLRVGAPGANSTIRRELADRFRPSLDVGTNKYIWLGTSRLFHGLTLTFRESPAGVFAAHSYKFDPARSTFIVECAEEVWRRTGLDRASDEETCAILARVFAEDLQGAPLLSNNFIRWINFVLVRNARWHDGRTVLLGDALHTAHFSIGSGTRLGLEDAIALADCLARWDRVEDALDEFERTRKPLIEDYQAAALDSLLWFEHMADYMRLEPMEFAYTLMTRSRKITYEKLKARDPGFIAAYDASRKA